MKIEALLNDLFPLGHSVDNTESILTGLGTTAKGRNQAVMGTTEHLAIGVETGAGAR
ncbi:MAG: hypothetical protein MH213_15220 [Marinobacter sp.]|nr:hypothetical protein [Marinobacter sp.]